ncbi:MAG TPA: tRNA guanosine(34) transglycosylase Tgt [Planctomycetota bacterium]|nr:tRNA guanosine(34) transglycosylase Tgt [Planctomycetota bacterium]
MLTYQLRSTDGLARRAVITTAHGQIETPNFMTVGTLGDVKGILPQQLMDIGAQVMLMNAFHLAWRPGEELVRRMGGLHKFCGWPRPILTDSGGFQIFSLPGLRKITDEGALFANAVDGSLRLFSPEAVVDIECALAPDMAMVLDECPPYPCTPQELTNAVDRSIRWAERSWKHVEKVNPKDVNFFGIVQGGFVEKERQRSLDATAAIPFPGLALGGFCVGETIEDTHRGITYTAPKMPADRPRYLMGMGTPEDILLAVAHGIDLFDCTIPTRNGRNGLAFTATGTVRIKNSRHGTSSLPLDPHCSCYTCRTFSRAYLRHLFLAREMNAAILMSLHNVAFYLQLMQDIRKAIEEGRLAAFSGEFLARFQSGTADQ